MHAVRDLFIRFVPDMFLAKKYSYAFIVHPRDLSDIFRKYPFLKKSPRFFQEAFAKYFWPVTVSRITGLQGSSDRNEIPGFIISIPMTARLMLEHRSLAQRRIRQAIRLAEKKGAEIIGLGALTSSVTGGGTHLISHSRAGITTGHAYTGYNVTQNIIQLVEKFKEDPSALTVAIVGAAGSVGSISAQILAKAGYSRFLLVDLERKHHLIDDLVPELKKLNPEVSISITHRIGDIRNAEFVIAATNAPEAVIHADDLKSGAIIINDAQPSDVAADVYERDDVLVVEAGVVRTPGISSNFNLGLHDKFNNFCCMAEVLILAAKKHDTHYVIHRPTLNLVEEIGMEGKRLGFTIAHFQNEKGLISDATLECIGRIRAGHTHAI